MSISSEMGQGGTTPRPDLVNGPAGPGLLMTGDERRGEETSVENVREGPG